MMSDRWFGVWPRGAVVVLASLAALPMGCTALPKACTGSDTQATVDPNATVTPPPPVKTENPDMAGGPPASRVIILGFDGVDPDFVDRWREALPNLERLLGGRPVDRLATTTPPQSPVAWTTFATGRFPGGSGIYDFLARDPKTYMPMMGTNSYTPATFDSAGRLDKAASGSSPRQGTPFWKVAADAGKRARILFVPYTFPPDDSPKARVLSGLGVPDIKLTNSTSFIFSSTLSDDDDKKNAAGVELVKLAGTGPYTAQIVGPMGLQNTPVSVPLEITVVDKTATIKTGDVVTKATLGVMSDWVTLEFPVSNFYTIKAVVRFEPLILDAASVKIYMDPLMVDPHDPYVAISAPESFAATVWDAYGPYKTIGWEHDTSALQAEQIDEGLFVDQLHTNFNRRLEITLGEIRRNDAELVVSVFTEPDRASHMMMRLTDNSHPAYDPKLSESYGNVIKETYLMMDDAVGKIVKELKPTDTLILLSDHGFHSFKRGFNTNSWLLDNGYLALKPGVKRGDDNKVLSDVDWSRTKAYALGTGQIYVNMKGREGSGIVAPEAAVALSKEIAGKLQKIKDGTKPVFSNVYIGADTYKGATFHDRGPDLQLAFLEGYQTSRKTSLGGIPMGLFEDNKKKWSGEHAASDAKDTEGFIVTTLGPLAGGQSIADVGPTTLTLLGVPVPTDYEGKSFVPGKK